MKAGKSADYRRAVGDIVHQAMVDTMQVPADDRFQVITEHLPNDLVYDPRYLGITRTGDVLFIQITLNAGRSTTVKQAFYRRVADVLSAQLGVRPEDVLINLVEVPRENWSFGNGIAQYAT